MKTSNILNILLAVALVILSIKVTFHFTSPSAGKEPTEDTLSSEPISSNDAKVVVLVAHPDLTSSHANAALIKAAEEVKGVQVINIYEHPINSKVYKDVIQHASTIVYQFPVYWLGAPGRMKEWTDKVFTDFEKQKGMIQGKKLMVCCTVGGSYKDYQHNGSIKFTMDEYLIPYQGQAYWAKMKWEKPVVVYDQMPTGGEKSLAEGRAEYKARLESLAK